MARIDLNDALPMTIRSYPCGIEKQVTTFRRLGDYFDSINVATSGRKDDTSFKMVFRVRHGVDHYWKDLMLRILRSFKSDDADVSIEKSP